MTNYDVILRNGTIYDGSGDVSYIGSLAINKDQIVAIGNLKHDSADLEIDTTNLAIAPGFINMLSWAADTLIEDGKSQSDIKQGVTLEVMGEGWSWGPLNKRLKEEMISDQGDIQYPIEWTTLSEFLEFLKEKGVSTNVGSFVGAITVRIHVIGHEDRNPNSAEIEQMKALVDQAMQEGAFGVASALIYPPGIFADTNELIELCKVASRYNGMYISHLRSEGENFLEAFNEFLTIAKEAEIRAEVYHLKASGKSNWHKLDLVTEKIDQVRKEGFHITTNMYTYTAGATGLNTLIPPWAHEGGHEALIKRLKNPETREKIKQEIISTSDTAWENVHQETEPENMLLISFKSESLKPLTGKSLAQIAEERNTSPIETAMDLIIEDDSRIGTVFFLMSEENVRKKVQLSYMSFGSDEGSYAPEGVFIKSNCHPRAYGNFSRLLGHYCRDEGLITLEDAIYRLTKLPATNLKISKRGELKEGYFADIAIFDPNTIQDHATYEKPHQFSTGMIHVFVNGVQVLKDGEHTGATPGRVVRGPGWTKK
ncbi:MAG: N-acyl-D-amino-acid deacylase family protein [Candidatus Hodarchaeales archaeon]